MCFIKIITGLIIFSIYTLTSFAQEVDYSSFKYGDTLPNGLISSGVSQIGKSSLKKVSLLNSLEYRSGTVKTIILDGKTIKEFNNWVCVDLNDDYIIVSDEFGNIYIYDREWVATASFNINHIDSWKNPPQDPLCPFITRSNLFLFYFGSQIVFINSLGEVVFKYDNAFEGNGFIHYMSVFEMNHNELVVDLGSYNDEREVYHIDFGRKIITKGPDIDEIAKENKLGETKKLYYSTVSGYLYVNCQHKFFITDWNQSFLTIPNDKLRYDFNMINPVHIKNSNKILLYSPKYPNELRVFDIENGLVVENIKFKEFFSETNEKIDKITYIVEAMDSYTIVGLVNKSPGVVEQLVLKSIARLGSENYKKMKISQATRLGITEDLKFNN